MHWRIHTEQQRKFQPNRLEDHVENVPCELYYHQHSRQLTCTFNEGTRGLLAVFDVMGIKLGPHAHTFATEEARRRLKITADAASKAEEGTLYGFGIDDSV